MNKRPAGLLLLSLLLVVLAMACRFPAAAQGEREIDIIASIGQEQAAQREAAAAAAAEAEHRATLEEQSRLRTIYQDYLGQARRTAQAMVNQRLRSADAERVEALRRQARVVIDEVDDATKQRVRDELDAHYAELEAMLAPTREQMLQSNPALADLRKRLSPGSGNELDWVEDAAIMYALCTTREAGEVVAGNIQFREELSADEAQAIDACNRRRLVLGLNPLAVDMKLVNCGRDHSKDMIEHGFFAHESPVEGKTTPWDRARNFGTSASGENIAAGYANGHEVTMGWWYSPGHLKNMMGRGHQRIAVGQEAKHYTQMFGR